MLVNDSQPRKDSMNDRDEFSQQIRRSMLLLWFLAALNLDLMAYHVILAWATDHWRYLILSGINLEVVFLVGHSLLRIRRVSRKWNRVTRTYRDLVAVIESETTPSLIRMDHACEQYEAAIKEALKQ